MTIQPTSAAQPVAPSQRAAQAQPAAVTKPAASTSDRVEMSGADDMQRLVALAMNGSIRPDKVADMKAQIKAGTYDVDAKADVVADRLLEDL